MLAARSDVRGARGASADGRLAAGRAAAALLAILAAGGGARADVRPLTLYQKTARAALVARVKALSDATRRPPMEVLEIYKGVYPGRILYIVPYAPDHARPRPWLKREVFRKGVEYVLFLNPHDPDRDDAFHAEPGEAAPDDERPERLFEVLNADQGVSILPEEGGAALSEALKRFVAILSLGQHDLQAEALRGLLGERNPYLAEAGLEEVERFDLGVADDLDALQALLGSPRGSFRSGALRVIAQIGRASAAQGREVPDQRQIFARVVDRAYNDDVPEVRRAAVLALAGLGGPDAAAVLRAVGERDPSQDVRYEAQRELYSLADRPGADPARP